MGALQFYELRLDMFEYSGERFNTGLYEIDKLETRRSTDIFMNSQFEMETGDPPLPILSRSADPFCAAIIFS